MSFPEYLRERISEDYKNLIIQKLEEIKRQTENLGAGITPAVEEAHQALSESLRGEVRRMEEKIEAELAQAQQKISEQLSGVINEYLGAWYHSDVSPYQQQLDMLISDIVSNVPPPPPPPPKEQSKGVASLVDLVRTLDEANTQSEMLNLVLQHISSWVDRAVLFVVKGDQASAWAALGLGSAWDANKIRQIKVGLGQDHILREVVSHGASFSGSAGQFPENSQIFFQIGDTFPQSVLAAPVLVRGKIAGILYADLSEDLSEKPDLPNLICLAAHAAGSAIDLLALKVKPAVAKPAAAPVAAPAPHRAEVTKPAAQPVPPPPPAPVVPPPEVEDAPGATVMMRAPAPISEEDQKLHDDAKRFARLLVSEIKLYNEAQVSAGREHKDLYDRLKDDIERSRRMYQERVAQQIQGRTDYFYEELVKTLANGDPGLLGM